MFFLTLLLAVSSVFLLFHMFKNVINSILRSVFTLLHMVLCLYTIVSLQKIDDHEYNGIGWFTFNMNISTTSQFW